jgi:hypothetical protein
VVFLFRDKSIINIFFLVILSIGIHIHFFTVPPIVFTSGNDGVFSFFLRNYVAPLPPTVLFILYHAIVLLQAIRLNFVLNDLRMFQQSSYVTAMTYVLLTALLPQWCHISPALLANFLLIWLFTRLCRLYNHPSPKTLLFNTGLIVGLSVIFYHPTAIFMIVVLFALVEVRSFNTAEWVVLLMGIVLPYYFLLSWFFLQDKVSHFSSFIPLPGWSLPIQQWSTLLIVSLSLLLIILLLGLYYWQQFNKRMVIQIRKNWGLMLMLLLILLPIPFIYSSSGIESAQMALIPLAAFASNAFSYTRRLTLPNILFWMCIGLIAYNNWILMKN